MSNEKYRFISLKVIIDRIMDDPIMKDINIDTATREAVDCIQIIANPDFMYTPEPVYLDVEEYKAELPYNLVNILKVDLIDGETNRRISLNTISDPYYRGYNSRTDRSDNNEYSSYKIQGDYLYTNYKTGRIHLAYEEIPVDTDGFIMIPDNSSVIKCVEFYIKAYHYHIKWVTDKLSGDKFKWVNDQKDWYMGKAQSSQLLEGYDTANSLANILGTFINNKDSHILDYTHITDKEYRRTYR